RRRDLVVGQERRVVAEAAVAARLGGQRAGAAALEQLLRARRRVDERDDADVRQRAAGRRVAQQLAQVLLVRGALAGEARRVDAGPAVQRRGLDARVVGDHD